MPGERLDDELRDALKRLGLEHKVHLIVADSATADPPPDPLQFLFIDGDHSYEGAKRDFERWGALVEPGGHLLFHDAVDTGGYGNVYPGVARVAAEVVEDPRWQTQPPAGSIAHFVRRP
jgi:predicted O-methyltransferase YrrM